jgi:F0F1-type ATP synthase epsilon subunit
MPGVVAIHNGSAVQEFFVSGGFATIDGANAHVTVAEAVPVETIDGAAVAAGAVSDLSCDLSSVEFWPGRSF